MHWLIYRVLRFINAQFPKWMDRHSAGDPNATWSDMRFIGWRKNPQELEMAAQLLGKRSDGVDFCMIAILRIEEFHPVVAEFYEVNMRRFLDRFLHCRCVVDRPCLRHRLEKC